MKKICLMLITFMLLTSIVSTVFAYSQYSKAADNGFDEGYILPMTSGADDMIAVASKQIGRTKAQFGYTVNWCALFISDCAIHAEQGEAIPGSASPKTLYNNIISAGGRVVSASEAQPGDIWFGDWNKKDKFGHVEVIYNVSGGKIRSYGGNSGKGDVADHSNGIPVNKTWPTSAIYVIVRPDYKDPDPAIREYLNKCTPYNAYLSIKATQTLNLRNMPCNTNTDPASTVLVSVPAETVLTATGIYLNTEGNLWYRISYNGKTYYVYAAKTRTLGLTSDVHITDYNYPTVLTYPQSFPMKGIISSSRSIIQSVSATVENDNIPAISAGDNVSNNYYSLSGSAIDKTMTFKSLGPGTYTYKITAVIVSNYVSNSGSLTVGTQNIPLLAMNFTVNGVSSHTHNYTDSGYTAEHPHYIIKKCGCGDTKTGTVHYYTTKDFVITQQSCTNSGIVEKQCASCGYIISTDILPAPGHTEVVDVKVEATCSQTGLTEGKHCSVCGEVLISQSIIPAVGHSETIIAGTTPTCTQAGLTEGKYCSVCNATIIAQEEIPATGHTETLINIKEATEKEEGYTGDTVCTTCGEILIAGEIVPALGDPVLFGDTNLDGEVDAKDATQILRFVNGKASSLDKMDKEEMVAAADTNIDSEVDAKDATQILRFVNGKASKFDNK